MIRVIKSQQNEDDATLWHFKIAGVALDGNVRYADLSRNTVPDDWLAAHQVEAQALINTGQYNEDLERRLLGDEAEQSGKQWLTSNPIARGLITQDLTVVLAWIDGATLLQLRELLKVLAVVVRARVKREF